MTALTFAEVEKPSTTRSTEPNPYTDAVASLFVKNDDDTLTYSDKALSFLLPGVVSKLSEKGHETTPEIARAYRRLSEAGEANGVTVRKRAEPYTEGTGKTAVTGTKITFWVTARILHKPRETAQAGASAAPEASAS